MKKRSCVRVIATSRISRSPSLAGFRDPASLVRPAGLASLRPSSLMKKNAQAFFFYWLLPIIVMPVPDQTMIGTMETMQ